MTCSFGSGIVAILLALPGAGVDQGTAVLASQKMFGVTVKVLTDVVACWGLKLSFSMSLRPMPWCTSECVQAEVAPAGEPVEPAAACTRFASATDSDVEDRRADLAEALERL